jgi:hypothetical protein
MRISAQEILDGITSGEHADDLVHLDPRACNACLAVADFWVR